MIRIVNWHAMKHNMKQVFFGTSSMRDYNQPVILKHGGSIVRMRQFRLVNLMNLISSRSCKAVVTGLLMASLGLLRYHFRLLGTVLSAPGGVIGMLISPYGAHG